MPEQDTQLLFDAAAALSARAAQDYADGKLDDAFGCMEAAHARIPPIFRALGAEMEDTAPPPSDDIDRTDFNFLSTAEEPSRAYDIIPRPDRVVESVECVLTFSGGREVPRQSLCQLVPSDVDKPWPARIWSLSIPERNFEGKARLTTGEATGDKGRVFSHRKGDASEVTLTWKRREVAYVTASEAGGVDAPDLTETMIFRMGNNKKGEPLSLGRHHVGYIEVTYAPKGQSVTWSEGGE
jgi:hypothetical protein